MSSSKSSSEWSSSEEDEPGRKPRRQLYSTAMKRKAPDSEQEDEEEATPKKKRKLQNSKPKEKKDKQEEAVIYVVQSEWIGVDDYGNNLPGEYNWPNKVHRKISKAFNSLVAANKHAQQLFIEKNKKKSDDKSSEQELMADKFNKLGRVQKWCNMADGWEGVKVHVWVQKVELE